MMTAAWTVDQTQILTRKEVSRVVADLKRRGKRSVNSRQNLAIFRLATCCGLRVSEISKITLADVVLGVDKPHIRIRKAVGKGQKSRRIPLWWDAQTLDDLTAWREERKEQGAKQSDSFCCSQADGSFGNQLDRFALRDRFRVACRVLGERRRESLTIHDARHSYVSHCLAGGRSLAEVKAAAGHANIQTTSIYVHLAVDDEGEVGDLFDF